MSLYIHDILSKDDCKFALKRIALCEYHLVYNHTHHQVPCEISFYVASCHGVGMSLIQQKY